MLRFIASVFIALFAALAVLPPAMAATPTARTSAVLAVRSGPGFGYAAIGTLAKTQRVTLSYCTRSGNWCQLGGELTPELEGGWVRAGYLVGMAAKSFVTPFQFSINPPPFGHRGWW
jgi:uncharacterized protein YraI